MEVRKTFSKVFKCSGSQIAFQSFNVRNVRNRPFLMLQKKFVPMIKAVCSWPARASLLENWISNVQGNEYNEISSTFYSEIGLHASSHLKPYVLIEAPKLKDDLKNCAILSHLLITNGFNTTKLLTIKHSFPNSNDCVIATLWPSEKIF